MHPFFIVNSFLLMLSFSQDYIINNDNDNSFNSSMTYETSSNSYVKYSFIPIINTFIAFTFRDLFLVFIIDYFYRKKEYININIRNHIIHIYTFDNIKYVLLVAFMDTLAYLYIKYEYDLNNSNNSNNEMNYFNIIIWYAKFIIYSFVFEIIFDLFHYITHLSLHKIPKLYYFHKTHHSVHNPISILTFKQHPIDYFITNTIPLLLTVYLMNNIYINFDNLILITILTYKTHIEIGGHCGKKNKTPSFPQFIWLPKWLNISLYTIDHDRHHTLNNCNYSKRFRLWDKVFGTLHICPENLNNFK